MSRFAFARYVLLVTMEVPLFPHVRHWIWHTIKVLTLLLRPVIVTFCALTERKSRDKNSVTILRFMH